MSQEAYEYYRPYDQASLYSSPATGVLDAPEGVTPSQETGLPHPPIYPPRPVASPPSPPKKPRRSGAIILLALVLAVIFGTGLFAGWEFSSTSRSTTSTTAATSTSGAVAPASTVELEQEAAIAKIEPSVVELKVTTAQGEQIGSGVIIDSKGDIVTNNHVISGAQSIEVDLYNGKATQAQVIGTSAANDLAVVRIQPYANMAVAQVGDSTHLVVGQEVLAVGNPLGITQTATEGIVSALNRSVTEDSGATLSRTIQTSAAVNPGNSGGALINLQGELIGIPTLTAVNSESNTAANGVSFALPSSVVKTVVQQILQ